MQGGETQRPRITSWLRANGFPTATSGRSKQSLALESRRFYEQYASKEEAVSTHVLGDRANDAPHSTKTAYAAFLSAITDAMQTEIGGPELQGIAFDVFVFLQQNGHSSGAAGLSKLLGAKVTQDKVDKVNSTHSKLAIARKGLGLPPAEHPPPAPDSPPYVPRYFKPTNEPLPFNAVKYFSKMCAPPDLSATAGPSTAGAPSPSALAEAYKQTQQSDRDSLPTTFQLVAPDPPKAVTSSSQVHGDLDKARGKMSLTTLQRIICDITGQPPPSQGGDETVLLLVLQTLIQSSDPDAAAGQLLEVLGFDHMERISDIVSRRDVRPCPLPIPPESSPVLV